MFRNHYRLAECRECGTECVQRRRVPRQEVHLVLTVLTLGLWGPCWIITAIAAQFEPWRCRECRRPQPEEKASPDMTTAGAMVGSTFALTHGRAGLTRSQRVDVTVAG